MTNTKLPPKVYVRGAIGKTKELQSALAEYGATNPTEYKFGDPAALYYVDKRGCVQITYPDTDIYYIITNSDWKEIKPKQQKKDRKYILTIHEGSCSCEGCEYAKKCSQEQRNKCELARLLANTVKGPALAGKTLQIQDVTDIPEPPSALTPDDY